MRLAGLTDKPMLIPQVDFSDVERALGAESAVIRSLGDLSALQAWIDGGAKGSFVALPDHLDRPGTVAERVNERLAGGEGGGGLSGSAGERLDRTPAGRQVGAPAPTVEHESSAGRPSSLFLYA